MTRVVVDTNVLVSALINEHGAEAAVLLLIAQGHLIWCVSEVVLTEYDAVLSRPKFAQLERSKIAAALALAGSGDMTIVKTTVTHSTHEPDNRFLECAVAANADYLVTGNARHFPKQWKATRIVNAGQLFRALKE